MRALRSGLVSGGAGALRSEVLPISREQGSTHRGASTRWPPPHGHAPFAAAAFEVHACSLRPA
eukprot:320948-Alexandrium_andersonii.AAC.1